MADLLRPRLLHVRWGAFAILIFPLLTASKAWADDPPELQRLIRVVRSPKNAPPPVVSGNSGRGTGRQSNHGHHDHPHHFVINLPFGFAPVFHSPFGLAPLFDTPFGFPVFSPTPFVHRRFIGFTGFGFTHGAWFHDPFFGYRYYGPWGWPRYYGRVTPQRLPDFVYQGPRLPAPAAGPVKSTTIHDGWSLLAAGETTDAIDVFTDRAAEEPSYGGWKIGHSLALAAAGNLNMAVGSMRYACAYHPASVQLFDLKEPLQPTVRTLVEQYEAQLNRAGRQPDAAFMLAALYYFQRDSEAAVAALSRAARDGDDTESLHRLRQVIDRHARRIAAAD